MNITKQRTKSYKKTHLKEFYVKLDDNQAFNAVHNLAGFYKTLNTIFYQIKKPAFLYRLRSEQVRGLIEKIE
jgi:hypothetical protein